MMKSVVVLFPLLVACVEDVELDETAMVELSDDGKDLYITRCAKAWGKWCESPVFTQTIPSPPDRRVTVEIDGHVADVVLSPLVTAVAPKTTSRATPVVIDFDRQHGLSIDATLVTICGDQFFDLKFLPTFDGTLDLGGEGTCSHFVRITQSSERAVDDGALRVYANQSVDVEITSTP